MFNSNYSDSLPSLDSLGLGPGQDSKHYLRKLERRIVANYKDSQKERADHLLIELDILSIRRNIAN